MEKTPILTIATIALLTAPALAGGISEDVWAPSDRLISPEVKPWSGFGQSIAEENGTAAVGAPGENAVYVFDKIGASWIPTASLTPSSAEAGFGRSVALDADGDELAVAAPWDSAVHVYQRTGLTWALEATLHGEDSLGIGLAIEDGVLFAGAPDPGVLQIFEETEDGWTEIASTSGDGAFGFSVALTPDAERAAVGSISESEVHVFDETSTGYAETAVLTTDASQLGFSVDLTPDGGMLAAGALADASVRVFEHDGGAWTEDAELTASDATSSGLDDGLGAAVEVADDGSTIFAGTFHFAPTKPGSAFVFAEEGDGWEQSAQLLPPEPIPKANFGRSLALASDGGEALVGAPRSGVPEASTLQPGSVYAFLGLPNSVDDTNGGLADATWT